MKSQVLIEDDPLTVRVYEEPEFSDALPWVVMTLLLLVVTGLVSAITNPGQTLFAIAVVVVISLPFYVNRFILKRGSVGGESFKIQRFADTIMYRSREYHIDSIDIELKISELKYQNMYELNLVTENHQIKLRSDFAERDNESVTIHIAEQLDNHLGLEIRRLE